MSDDLSKRRERKQQYWGELAAWHAAAGAIMQRLDPSWSVPVSASADGVELSDDEEHEPDDDGDDAEGDKNVNPD